MTLVVVAVVAIAALTIGFALASAMRDRSAAEIPSATSDKWLDNARTVVRDGYELTARMTASAERSPTSLSDDDIVRIVSEIKDFNARLAAISATAPTVMDTRVCRSVGVRANAVREVYEWELRMRKTLGAEHRLVLAGGAPEQPAGRLEEFEVALRDLDEHVDLL